MAEINGPIKTAIRFAKQLSEEELKVLQKISVGLNPRKADDETKKQWYTRFEKNKIHYKLWSKTFDDELKVMAKMNKSYSKRQLQQEMASAIKSRQEDLGLSEYLMNTVRISLFKTITRIFNNPKLLNNN